MWLAGGDGRMSWLSEFPSLLRRLGAPIYHFRCGVEKGKFLFVVLASMAPLSI
jgi:hypothetical protein